LSSSTLASKLSKSLLLPNRCNKVSITIHNYNQFCFLCHYRHLHRDTQRASSYTMDTTNFSGLYIIEYFIATYSAFVMSLETDNDSMMEILTKTREDPISTKPGRGWRFYGTFACLALLNLVCAIDATILAVALPVRLFYATLEALLTNFCRDHCHRFERYSDSSFLVRNIIFVMLNGLS
jgi:hypothetical protein